MATKSSFERNVFINCPFDQEFLPLLRPLLFTVLACGFTPRIALERFDSGEARVNKLTELIKSAKYSIHDLSRFRSKQQNEYYRLNMPFEMGLDIGCRLFGSDSKVKQKCCLILEEEQYSWQKALSDLSNSDVKTHHGDPERLVMNVRTWFAENGLVALPFGTTIWEDFNEFMTDFYIRRKKEGFKQKDMEFMSVPEYVAFIQSWLHSN
jgi:hypothetical protein